MTPYMGLSPGEFCGRAIAYLKGVFPNGEGPGAPPVVGLSAEDSPAMRSLCDGLVVMYVVDVGDVFQYVHYRDLKASGLAIDELHARAVDNLAAICRERLEVRKHSNVFAFLMGGDFEASCMLLDDLFDRTLAPHVPNGYVAAAPSRDIFAACSRDSAAGIKELRELVERVWPGGDHLVSKELFVREGRAWRPMREPASL